MRGAACVVAVARKDFSIWLRRPVAILTTLTPSVMYVIVVYYISISVGTPPIAVVSSSHGAAAQRLVTSLRDSGGFRANVVPPAEAQRELAAMKVAAIVTIPRSFDREVPSQRPVPVSIEMNNLNADIAGDLRRSLAFTMSRFGAAAGSPDPVAVSEHDTHTASVSLAQFRLLPGLVLILTIAGIVNTGLATCQEFEAGTFKELLLAPAPTWSLVGGKIVGGWLTTLMIAAVMWVIGLTTGLIAPALPYLAPALLMSALVGLAASCIGVAMGSALRQFQLVTSLSVMVALYLFFLAGGVSVLAFLPHVLQGLTIYDPLYYAIHALEQVVLNGSVREYGRDLAVMTGFALAAAGVSAAVLRRRVTT